MHAIGSGHGCGKSFAFDGVSEPGASRGPPLRDHGFRRGVMRFFSPLLKMFRSPLMGPRSAF